MLEKSVHCIFPESKILYSNAESNNIQFTTRYDKGSPMCLLEEADCVAMYKCIII